MPDNRPTETELKFLVSQEAATALRSHPALQAPEQSQKLRSTYFDTASRRLQRGRMALRLRDDGQEILQTLKQSGGPGAFSRGEWERTVDGESIDREALAGTPAFRALGRHAVLEPVFVTSVDRNLRRCTPRGAMIEVAYDVGELEAGERRAPIRELELELKSGAASALFDLARRLVADVDIRLSFESKSERGYRLADQVELQPRKAQTVALDPKMPAAAAFKALAVSCLAQAAANAELLAGVARPEAVHQMRIGLRRLRAVMKAFEPMLPGEDAKLVEAELKWLAGELDPARDLDVLISAGYRPALEALDDRGFAPLGRQLLAGQTKAYRRAQAAARSRRCAQLWLEAAAWIQIGTWTRAEEAVVVRVRELPIRRFAMEALDHLLKVVCKRCRRWPKLDARGRHKLRIRAKLLRYAAELFLPLFLGRTKRRKAFVKSLKALQGLLGDLNDIHSAREDALGNSGADDPGIAFALGRMVGWREFDETALKTAAGRQVKAFADARPFWG